MLFPENESQRSFNLLFSKNPNPMWVYNQNNLKFLDVNEAAVVHYGYSREEFLQMRITDIHPSEDVPILLEYLEQKHSNLDLTGRWRHQRKDGKIIDVEIFTQTIDYNSYQTRLVHIRNITEHKQIEKKVRDGRLLDTSWTNVYLSNGQIISIGQDITERKQTELAFKAQAEREQLMRTVSQRIRQSLNLQDILNATVQEVRDLLEVDRVVVYQFDSKMIGTIMAESVEPGWTVSLSVEIHDTCFQTGAGLEYYQGCKRAIANIYEAGLTDCHIGLLEQFEVKANLVVPILLEVSSQNPGSHIWGLLIAHQCSGFREWEENQLDLLDQVTVQLAIAIQQSSILEQAKTELVQRQKAQTKLKTALAEKEVLLKEVHHRVKNNLQIVSSLLQLQSQTLKDPEIIKVFRESQNRIESISLIHKNLYTSANIGQINVADYISNLAANLLISYQICPGKIALETDIDSVSLNIDQAIACGLVINELISNALKHAFPNQQIGTISIALHNVGNSIEMTIRDNGIGLPDNLDWRNTDSLGLSLVHDLVTEQLEGDITLERNHGTVFKIKFTQLTLH
ncbi:histidine kinase dimerization/phosphoacceptor domain -containing protein [Nostoc sp.]|uniref:histidine kinase dimerization/phosphoacceptor domain -containing protein n=1 Tax=Nostoc sp. TaxID=1180 RepID=UPI002FF627EB